MFCVRAFFKCVCGVVASVVGAAEWGTEYEPALALAQEQRKPVLVNFTGSDWCGYCMRLRAEVLDEPSFASWAAEHFVLLEVDVPQHPKFSREKLAQNRALCEKYRIDGFPSLLVLDAKGRAVGCLFGYEANPEIVRKSIEPGWRAVQYLRAAESLQGEAKVHAMVEAWKLVPEDLHDVNKELRAEIVAIDTQDLSGLKSVADAERRLQACKHAADAAPTDAVALEIVEAALFEAVPYNKRQLLELKYRLLISCAQTEADVLLVAEVAYAIIDADLRIPASEKSLRKQQLKGVFANPRTTLNRSRMLKRHRPIR